MKLKNNRGYVAIDASIAVLVLLIIVPTIAGMIYNVNKTNNLIERKNEAISIAINTIETVKGIGVHGDINETVIKDKLSEIYTFAEDNTFTSENINDEATEFDDKINSIQGTLTKDENTYKIQIHIQDYANTQEAIDKKNNTGIEVIDELIKIVKVKVTFKSGNQQKDIELNTVIN